MTDDGLGRTIIITGAASGIGAAIARRVAAPGAALLLHTRKNETGLKEVATFCAERGAQVETMLGELADPDVPSAVIAQARQRFGRVDQIVSNAGQAVRGRFGTITPEELSAAFDAMPTAFLRLVTAALADIENSAWGRVVAVSSFVAHVYGTADLLFPATSAAKAAIEALVKALAVQLGPAGATANAVVPGFTRKQGGGHLAATSQSLVTAAAITPTRRLTEPADIAAAVEFLLSRSAAQVTGQTLHVDGGLLLS